MDTDPNVGGRERIGRFALAAVLTLAAIRSFRNGKRARGLLAGAGALVFGFTSTTKYCPANDALGRNSSAAASPADIDFEDTDDVGAETTDEASGGTEVAAVGIGEGSTAESAGAGAVEVSDARNNGAATAGASLTCAACGNPIVPGQGRGPNENDEIVHESCP